ncbi:uncharacterized protein LOC115632491 [Scaptodrosophila lebanonensis]|uniref:Uncharacterized protein LOC115632491 n=1 Tax=Drosophila lebanonensis TaxID=7225 RepID=A0A6J2UDN3_DROLE|nr:uncharacterized protein LOC115632491 [Scaptodrosophila lebanonensis]
MDILRALILLFWLCFVSGEQSIDQDIPEGVDLTGCIPHFILEFNLARSELKAVGKCAGAPYKYQLGRRSVLDIPQYLEKIRELRPDCIRDNVKERLPILVAKIKTLPKHCE